MRNSKYIPYVIIIILGFLWLRQCSVTKSLKNDIDISIGKSDTIYKDKVIEIHKPYPVTLKPEKVVIYKTDTIYRKYESIKIINDTIILYSSNDSLDINKEFLLQFPNNHKLISFDLTRKELKLDLLSTKGITSSEYYPLSLERYKYRYVDNRMTVKNKKLFKLEPEVSYYFRPFNNMHDLNLLLKFKTSKFNYIMGVNSFLYPSVKDNLGYDAVLGISYNFK